ncbi:MAG: bifunctional glutamate N-acetyltransferase/amino-acid acetyltransferase ArgJ [Rhodospirillaceae bacterium]|nr:bifunctional glutamate N-acetyltransferase/amino-acid acetyltransferase ArgJ [Rhodospirillaceae bacterium]MBT5244621.1 bifunctional glutamate N-acetyltransferase/amino-acid acetyltransferase ArgJ [Rhodospirillaceae bacterium]MBT5563531.1 bifunctional glutamate N-acetyltransferase/amino-acid acetyltransferase ArgJ [Rhodospirillaceae bacterium]MBT7137744.1 bifunctional glutamate N-acetyltransferase/amino-acid acetyltransferase ArgJ [Rhodospirillaceae bacterium]
MSEISPLAPDHFPSLPALDGVRLGAGEAGIRYQGRNDLMVVEMAANTTVAGVFTRSLTASAPVEWCRKALSGGQAQVLIVNSGNANAFTGQAGVYSVERTVEAAADLFSCRPSKVFVASTGVIGETLADDKLTAALPGLEGSLDGDNWHDAAQAIMTTDTFSKGASRTAMIGDVEVTINGIAKGSGMIAPDMATMLAFVFTDADIPADTLQELLAAGSEKSFNAITVDSDTSTSDTLMLFATAKAGNNTTAPLDDFTAKLDELLIDLAGQVVRDGEGATKFISVTVNGAADDGAAKRIGLCIANSPLVKTAIAGEDANWGRIVMAVGKAGEKADRDKLAIDIGGIRVAADGMVVPGYDETPVAEHMKGAEIDILVDVGIGDGNATVWTCDLTHGYITINADYRS